MFQRKQQQQSGSGSRLLSLSTLGAGSAALLLLVAILATEVVHGTNATAVNRREVPSIQHRFDEQSSQQMNKAARLSQDKREIIQFLNTKNVIKTMYKILFGDNKDSVATSRQVLNVFVKMLELVKSSFGQRARSTSSGSRLRESVDGAAQAGISMLQSYVRSIMSTEPHCIQRNICEGVKSAVQESPHLGGLIVQLGGYATSYMLNSQRDIPIAASIEAVRLGRSGADCSKAFKLCKADPLEQTIVE